MKYMCPYCDSPQKVHRFGVRKFRFKNHKVQTGYKSVWRDGAWDYDGVEKFFVPSGWMSVPVEEWCEGSEKVCDKYLDDADI